MPGAAPTPDVIDAWADAHERIERDDIRARFRHHITHVVRHLKARGWQERPKLTGCRGMPRRVLWRPT